MCPYVIAETAMLTILIIISHEREERYVHFPKFWKAHTGIAPDQKATCSHGRIRDTKSPTAYSSDTEISK